MSIFQQKTTQKQPKCPLPLSELLPTQVSIFNGLAVGRLTHSETHTSNTQKKWFAKLIGLPAYYWVLLSQTVVILPHLAHMPVWLVVYGLFSIIMQLPRVKAVFAKRQKLKSIYRAVQLSVFLLAIGGLWITYRGFSVDVGVAFLVLCLSSKLWEMYQPRDAFIVLNLSLFVCASLFLLDQGLGSSLQALIALLFVLMAFVAMNDDTLLDSETGLIVKNGLQTNLQNNGAGRLRSVGVLAGFAIPLLVVLFLFFPRIPPLWSLQMSSGQAETGMSDSMSPGDFANLSQSTKLAFRVEFDGQRPTRQNMYWRGLVFSDFNGIEWTTNNNNASPWLESKQKPAWVIEADESSNEPEQAYQIILEPTNQQWLFALDYPLQVGKDVGKDIGLSTDFTLGTIQPVFQQRRYSSAYKMNTKISVVLSDYERKINLELPPKGNERSRKLAQDLASQVDSSEEYINAIIIWINQGNFSYTLSPPRLTDNRIDSFLFKTQAGFCEHYASSFAFLLRAGGIPARVVIGYQGGQLGRDGNSWEVRQMDAHAWTEVWLNGQGWVRLDPTSWIAPDRIELGMTEQGSDIFGSGTMAELNYQQYKLLQEFRRFTDQIGYYWDRDIVGFDQDKQSNSLLKWFNIKDVMQQIITMVVVFVVAVTLLMLIIWWRRRKQWHMADRELMRLSQRLGKEKKQLARADDEGMLAWLDRLENLNQYADYLSEIKKIKQVYRQLRYGRLSATGITEKGKATAQYQTELTILNGKVKALMKKL